ncbi:MAG: hypothetical protein KKE12_07500 [Proteobacteria bacterium]|nr:hypothetical protein [Pseudomonadota bacterium]
MNKYRPFIIIGLFVLVCGGIIVTGETLNVQAINPLNLLGITLQVGDELIEYQNKWLSSYETLGFDTIDGDIDFGEYAQPP